MSGSDANYLLLLQRFQQLRRSGRNVSACSAKMANEGILDNDTARQRFERVVRPVVFPQMWRGASLKQKLAHLLIQQPERGGDRFINTVSGAMRGFNRARHAAQLPRYLVAVAALFAILLYINVVYVIPVLAQWAQLYVQDNPITDWIYALPAFGPRLWLVSAAVIVPVAALLLFRLLLVRQLGRGNFVHPLLLPGIAPLLNQTLTEVWIALYGYGVIQQQQAPDDALLSPLEQRIFARCRQQSVLLKVLAAAEEPVPQALVDALLEEQFAQLEQQVSRVVHRFTGLVWVIIALLISAFIYGIYLPIFNLPAVG